MLKFWFTVLAISLLNFSIKGQLVINEASNRNFSQIADEDDEYNDWIELYNASNTDLNLAGWALSDSKNNPEKWTFESMVLSPGDFLFIHASGKDRKNIENLYWQSAVLPDDDFRYLFPISSTSGEWYKTGFNDSGWSLGKAGFGFGDNDDRTVVAQQNTVVFIRKKFTVNDPALIKSGALYLDYDDGFVAWLNGIEIARSFVNGTPQWNSIAAENHEAMMYSGGLPEQFDIENDRLHSIIKKGDNILSIAALNVSNTSSDFSMIPFLLFGFDNKNSAFRDAPDWFKQKTTGNLHTNFKISNLGENIYLFNSGSIVDSFKVEKVQINQSTGRVTDGSAEIGIFIQATPGKSNQTSQAYTQGFSVQPKINFPAGFYPASVEIVLTSDEPNAIIRYTLDGSDPSESSGRYSSPFRIQATKSLRARSFTPGKLPSEIVTATYFINEEYTLPVLSVNSNYDNIFGTNGIFTNWQQTFNVPSYVEYFEKNQKKAFGQFAGMQVDGGAGGSREKPQHSFRIEPGHGSLGDGNLKYKLMPRRPNRDNYPSFYVRNGSNQYLILPYKDALQVTALGRNTYTYYSAYHPIVVYINGAFFGVYELREKINDDYLVDNYQMNIDSLDFLGVSYFKGQQLEALRGSVEPFLNDFQRFTQMNPQSADYLEKVDEFLDLKSYTDYIIAESWVGNNDWPFNNIKLFRCSSTGFRWQWAINDLEWALNPNGWTTSSFDHIQYMLNQSTGNYYTGFWYNMMQNLEYKTYFVNRFADLMNTSYDFSVIGPLELEIYEEILPEMEHEYKRWGSSNITSQLTTFTNNHNTFRSELKNRSGYVRTHLKNHFNLKREVTVLLDVEPKGAGSIQISTITPTNYPWQGIYFGNVEVEVTAIPNLGFEFVNWDPNSFISDIYQSNVTGIFNVNNITIKANFEEVKENIGKVVISEFNYKTGNNQKNPDWIEICNFNDSDINLKGWYFRDSDTSNVFVIERDLILRSNERIVISNNYTQFSSIYPGVNVYIGEFGFGLGTPSDEIHLFNASHEAVFSVSYSDIYPWPLSDDQSGRTLELRTPGGNYSQSSSWLKGCIGGSPGTAYQFCEETSVSAPVVNLLSNDMTVYPNPAHDFIEIEFYLEHDVDHCDIRIYNLMGSELKSKTMGNIYSGNHRINMEIVDLQEQLLIVKIITNRGEKTAKVIKVK